MPASKERIPVIDVFAGPGGLGEGFAAWAQPSGRRPFKPALSIEKDAAAHRTLLLRAFMRQFDPSEAPEDYYAFLRDELPLEELYSRHPGAYERAEAEAWCRELLPDQETVEEVRERIRGALGRTDRWVLLGGPPCQPFSTVGRSRNRRGTQYSNGGETRHELYLEYLQILADHRPAVFVMENVRGLTSARFNGGSMLDRILNDLEQPARALKKLRRHVAQSHHQTYRLFPIGQDASEHPKLYDAHNYIVQCEHHGIPQARHRLILIGVRDDIKREPIPLPASTQVKLSQVIKDMPRLRSGLSRCDSPKEWQQAILDIQREGWVQRLARKDPGTAEAIHKAIPKVSRPQADRGDQWCRHGRRSKYAPDWFQDDRLRGVCNHQSRQHMESDLHRYMFSACFAEAHKRSPSLRDFPFELMPQHRSARRALGGGHFADRFRVQLWDRPATTIVSHIAKDGHYYIHPDPSQCRALTVREAARIQTFPDNYFFVGNRTEQYTQVGNAVPPLLARQIAGIVEDVLT